LYDIQTVLEGQTMKKAEIIAQAAKLCGQHPQLVRDVLAAAAEAAKGAVQRGEEVFLFGLGKLEVAARGAKKARNIWTGDTVTVPPRRVVLFKASCSLLASANAA